jgi:chromosome partitioning protein
MGSGTERCPVRIAVISLKGGVGKTITAVHLAAGLSERGPTLLVDADPYRSALRWSERAGERFPCPVVTAPGRSLHWHLPELARGHDHLVIDTPPNDEAVARSAILAATSIVVPVGPSPMDVDRLMDTLDLVAETAPSHPVVTHVLITRVRPATRSGREVRTTLERLDVRALDTQIPLREAYTQAFGARPAPHVDYADVLTEIAAAEPALSRPAPAPAGSGSEG